MNHWYPLPSPNFLQILTILYKYQNNYQLPVNHYYARNVANGDLSNDNNENDNDSEYTTSTSTNDNNINSNTHWHN